MTFNVFEFILDLFVPRQNINFKSISSYLSQVEIDEQQSRFKILDSEHKDFLEGVLIASKYSEFLIQNLIERAKFYGELAIVPDLARLVFSKAKSTQAPDLLVPVPADPYRKIQRGYHIPALLSKELSKLLKIESKEILLKVETTTQQTLLDRSKRLKNLVNKFQIVDLPGLNLEKIKNIWLIDDLVTTGTTLLECAKVIKAKHPNIKIYGVVISGN